MHIADGFLPAKVCIAGYAVTGLTTWYSLHQIHRSHNPQENLPKASLLTAAFFVASSIQVPIPPASVHLVLNGMLGAMLGYYAFPAILVGLFFQAIMFHHGGMSVLGINAAMMGIPALLAYHIFRLRYWFGRDNRLGISICGFWSGAIGIGLSALVFYLLVMTNIPADFDIGAEQTAIWILTLAHIPIVLLEGVFTAMLALFLRRVKPELLGSQ